MSQNQRDMTRLFLVYPYWAGLENPTCRYRRGTPVPLGILSDMDSKGLSVVFIEIVTRFLVVLQGAGLQILSLCFFRLLVCQFSRMAPFPFFFVFLDLSICFRNRVSFDNHRRSEKKSGDRVFTLGAKGQGGFGHPLDDLKTPSAIIAALF